ncbi:MAG: ABC transporter substrate-binding protein [Crocinitomicaceae bacterium]|nr:ABC transporter substrate-binding protein [Crocinitomicaceae bacterium]MBK6951500.1 ABC transporter substrate-binding protein [Crocinitomicaceae bacterium]MBK9590285.1 ABC transporter substrate-binding protein [Crocinitomicaceae bacterium]
MKDFKTLLFALTLMTLLTACGGDTTVVEDAIDPTKIEKIEGGKFKGGVLRLNSIEDYTSLFPVAINDIYSTHIAGQCYEGLFKFNQKTLEAEPCLAESFDIDNTKKVYTFHLRKGVLFHDDACFPEGKGREMNANDFKYCFEFLCSNHEENKWPTLFRDRIVGAHEYAAGTAKTVEGIKVIDNYTFELTLVDPFAGLPDLLAVLAAAVYPKEAIDKYGYEGMHNYMVGTGPFIATTLKNGENVEFLRNEKYWKKDEFGNQLPYLAKVTFSFIKTKPEELKSFQDGNLDMVWGLPVEEIPNIMASFEEALEGKNREFDLQSVNSLNIQYYGFLFTSETFSDVRVRKAFNYAIDRDSLVEFVLQGEGIPAHHGFVPPMSGYPTDAVKGFDYNPKLAAQLMKDAGFNGGKGFPEVTLHLNSSGGTNEKIAAYMQGMLKKNLGVTVNLDVIPMAELHPKAERGELDFWRFGWIADYPDPSNFLYLFHGKNIDSTKETSINYFRYYNPKFDELYEAALKEIDDKKRMELYSQCDQLLIDDAVVMPLLFNVDIRLINPEVTDFDINELEYRDLSVVYFKIENKTNVRVYDNLIEEEEQIAE